MLSRIGRYALLPTLAWVALVAAIYGVGAPCNRADRCDRPVDYATADKHALQRLLARP